MVDFTAKDIVIAADHPCFAGHFPGHPIFPAVAQIDLVLDLLQKHCNQPLTAVEISKAKFPAPIVPGTTIHVAIKRQDQMVTWQILNSDRIYSTGTLKIAVNSSTQLQ
ncbi:3-hydroxyacyl-ACP dehydratase [Oligoflexus tunisiensis]|uniref:3-hydroxyacyl-ACP dehydratase n=1 Tax=Oligoflexus tunisiensis TaxID=708132 RepID=UPI00114CCB6B|nr:3-hydroxyacyl-ACP dehydratase [Oligoflexus tunisiensis]